MNVLGILALGSDEEAILDLNPAKKKKQIEKEKKAAQELAARQRAEKQALAQAVQNGQISQQEYTQRDQLLNQNHARQAQTLQNDIQASRRETINEINQEQFGSGGSSGAYGPVGNGVSSGFAGPSQSQSLGAAPGGLSNGLFYAYLVDTTPGPGQGTKAHVLTFANATVANKWYQQVGQSEGVNRVSPQFFTYQGKPPHPVFYNAAFANTAASNQMMFFPANGGQALIPPQTAEGCAVGSRPCGSYSTEQTSSGNSYIGQGGAVGDQTAGGNSGFANNNFTNSGFANNNGATGSSGFESSNGFAPGNGNVTNSGPASNGYGNTRFSNGANDGSNSFGNSGLANNASNGYDNPGFTNNVNGTNGFGNSGFTNNTNNGSNSFGNTSRNNTGFSQGVAPSPNTVRRSYPGRSRSPIRQRRPSPW